MMKYLFVYRGGSMLQDEQQIALIMQALGEWLAQMAEDVVNAGKPVGLSATVQSDGSIADENGANPVSGHSVILACNLDDAHAKARACPILNA